LLSGEDLKKHNRLIEAAKTLLRFKGKTMRFFLPSIDLAKLGISALLVSTIWRSDRFYYLAENSSLRAQAGKATSQRILAHLLFSYEGFAFLALHR
jgi:hypothetical protein